MLNTRIMLDFKNKISDFRVQISYLFRCSIFYFLALIFTVQSIFQLPAQTLPNIKAIGTSSSQTTASTTLSNSSNPLRGNGMMFTENKGQLLDMNQQLRPDILFAGDAGGMDIFLRTTGISYVMSNIGEVTNKVDDQLEELGVTGIFKKVPKSEIEKNLLSKQLFKVNRIDMDFVNCRSVNEYDVQTFDKVDGYSNYYYSHCPDGIIHVNSYNKVTVKNIYNGIDVKYYGGKQNDLKYDIIVNPSADPSQIKLQYTGAKLIELRNGKLKIETSDGMLGEYMPKVYQNINGQIVDVMAEYELEMKCENIDNRNDNRKNKSYTSHLTPHTSHL